MKFDSLIENASRAFSKLKFKANKYSPEMLIAAGTIFIIGGTVSACKATLKMQNVLETTGDTIEQIHACSNGEATLKEGATYTEEDERKDLTTVYIQTAVQAVKLYAPAAILIGGGLGCMFGSHYIMRRREAVAVAAYTAVSKAFSDYRARVQEKVGKEVEEKLFHGIKEVEVEKIDENGNVQKEVKEVMDKTETDPYTFIFDETNPRWEKDFDYNRMFIKSVQNTANIKLKRKGYLFLNDVLDMLGFQRGTAIGQFAGWMFDPTNPDIDSYVDFGLYDLDDPNKVNFLEGYERSVVLHMNCDGIIINKI